MNEIICQYSTIQFLPYTETGEFANVGVVLACDQMNFFDFRLELDKTKRYTAFFRNVTAGFFKNVMQALADELKRRQIQQQQGVLLPEMALNVIAHPREAILRFSNPRIVLAEQCETELDALFKHYVQHDFARKETHQFQLNNKVKRWVNAVQLENPFKPERIGDGLFTVEFPLVQVEEGRHRKAIKPLFLGQERPNDIFDQADRWLGKFERLERLKLMPDKVLCAIQGPTVGSKDIERRTCVYREVADDFKRRIDQLVMLDDKNAAQKEVKQFAIG